MSSKLIPANPQDVMVIRNVTPNIVTLSVPFLRFGTVKVGGRGTLVKLTSGELAIFSAVALTDDVKAKVAELGGNLAYIVAPDIEHHIFVSDWKKAYPGAKIIGPEGLPEKRSKQKDEKISPDEFFKVFPLEGKRDFTITPTFDADFDYEFVDVATKELVFLYKPDKVLIEADFIFNLPAKEQYSRVPGGDEEQKGIATKIFNSVQTTSGDLKWARRFQWYAMSSKNRPSFNESIKLIDTWDFDTIIPCHGDVIQGDAKQRYRNLFEWHLTGIKH